MKKLIGIFIFSVLAISMAFTVNNSSDDGYKIGDLATNFSLINVDNSKVSLSDFPNAKGFIVIFTCNSCPYSVAYEDRIIELDKKYKGKGYPVIAINPNNPEVSKDDDFASMQKRAKEKGFTFPYLLDEGQKIYPQYGASRTPHVFLLNKENEGLKVAYIGAIDNNSYNASKATKKYVEDAVDALLEGKTPEILNTRAIGCRIKK